MKKTFFCRKSKEKEKSNKKEVYRSKRMADFKKRYSGITVYRYNEVRKEGSHADNGDKDVAKMHNEKGERRTWMCAQNAIERRAAFSIRQDWTDTGENAEREKAQNTLSGIQSRRKEERKNPRHGKRFGWIRFGEIAPKSRQP